LLTSYFVSTLSRPTRHNIVMHDILNSL